MIQHLTEDQIPLVGDLAVLAHADGHLRELDVDAFNFHWQKLLRMGIGAVFAEIIEGEMRGAIGCVVEADLYTGETLAREAFFYVAPKHRSSRTALALLLNYDIWAKGKGATRQYITAHWSEGRQRLDRLYRRRGYTCTEVTYGRDVEYDADAGTDRPGGREGRRSDADHSAGVSP